MADGERRSGEEVNITMKRILLFGILLIAMTVSGCSSGAATNSNARAGNTANRSANPSNTVTETTVTNTDVQTGTLASVPVGPEQGTVAANGIDAKRKLADHAHKPLTLQGFSSALSSQFVCRTRLYCSPPNQQNLK